MSSQFGLSGAAGSGSNTPTFSNEGHGHGSSLSMGSASAFGEQGSRPGSAYMPVNQVGELQLPKGAAGQIRRGVCKFFNSQKGFGFVLDNNSEELGGQEVFVHFTAIQSRTGFRSLAEGEEVEYEITTGPKGFQASHLTGPGGRPVIGDPKARLMKQPQFMMAPIAFPGPYGMDPYMQQHPGAVYAASPYTSHVLYVPSGMHPGQQGQYSQMMAGNGQFSPQMGNSFNGSNRNQMMGQQQGGFNSSPSGSFGPVGGMASTLGGFQQNPQHGFGNGMGGGGPASTFGNPGNGRYSAGLGQSGSAFGSGRGNGQDDGFGSFNNPNSPGETPASQQQASSAASSAFFGSGNLLYSSN